MLAEIQALLSSTAFSNPKRMAAGLDSNRLMLLLAVLEKKAGLRIYDKDVYINVVGGLKLDERACDLAVCLCIASALLDCPLPQSTVLVGEVSLTGDIRPVSRLDQRIQECARLGFRRIILPKCEKTHATKGVQLVQIETLAQAVAMLLPKKGD